MMKTQQLFLAFTAANATLLMFSLTQPYRTDAAPRVAPVLRAHAFEIVDDKGHLRAEIKVLPAQPRFKMQDATAGYPETVQLRLFSSQGGPNVKLAATEDGSGLVLGGDPGGYVQILARGTNPFLKLMNNDGRQQTVNP